MTWWQALILGLVEGVTEFLPVSSTGHLILARTLLGLADTPAMKAFEISVQSGAILAVFGLYATPIRRMIAGLFGRDADGLKLLLRLTLAFAITASAALALQKPIEKHLFSPTTVAIGWLVGGIGILIGAGWLRRAHERGGRSVNELTLGGAAIIGAIQCLGMWPGVSRSLVTIVGGLLVGLNLPAALEFSFLLGTMTLLAATGYKSVEQGRAMVTEFSPMVLAVAFVAAFASAWLAVRWMVGYLQRRGWGVFGVYRVVLGAGVLAWLLWPH